MMIRLALILFAGTLTVLAPAGAPCQDSEVFNFYGLAFGMSREDVKAFFPRFDGENILQPGHGMDSLQVNFDRQGLLIEIRAAYLRPRGPLQETALSRALREKFVRPVKEAFLDVDVSIDEFSNKAAYTLVFLSSALRDENIEFYKTEYLEMMK